MARFSLPTPVLLGLAGYYGQNGAYGLGSGARPSVVLEIQKEGEPSLVATKRFVVSVADLALANPIVEPVLHVRFCSPPEETGCVAWDPTRAGNHNPEFLAPLELARGASPLATFAAVCRAGEAPEASGCEPAVVKTGEKVRIRPSFTPESFESYQTLRTDLQSVTITNVPAVEELSVSWFTTAGSMQEGLTWPKFTSTLDTVYEAPAAVPSDTGGMVTIWLIARDQRGGESWTYLELLVTD